MDFTAHYNQPVKFVKWLWPDVTLYSHQREIMYSVVDNVETLVPAGNMLGKDFTAALTVLFFFLTRSPVRVVTTSADGDQLAAVLWGEIRRFIQTSKYKLNAEAGGPILVNHLHLRKVYTEGPMKGDSCGLSYVLGRVAAKGEGMLGHHIADTGDGIPRTLFVADEASGVDDLSWDRADTWAKRKLAIGNCYPCQNFFYKGISGGDLASPPMHIPILV